MTAGLCGSIGTTMLQTIMIAVTAPNAARYTRGSIGFSSETFKIHNGTMRQREPKCAPAFRIAAAIASGGYGTHFPFHHDQTSDFASLALQFQ